MEEKFIVKDFDSQLFYCGEGYEWSKESYLVEYFETIEDAQNFIKRENGKYQIEVVYFA